MLEQDVRLTEIFYSLQGESLFVGCPTVFIRLTGCPLRCQYCDTAYAFSGGKRLKISVILDEVAKYTPDYICVTGGEPLAQKSCFPLLTLLCDRFKFISLETSGAMPIEHVDTRVTIVMDVKTPGSKEVSKNLIENFSFLKKNDQIKFVLCNKDDFDWAKHYINTHKLAKKCNILFSPSWNELEAAQLAQWIINDKLPVRLQLQLHKILWHDERGR